MPEKTYKMIPHNSNTEGNKRFIRATKARTILAALAEDEDKSIHEMAENMRRDYQVRLAEYVFHANIKAANVTVSAAYTDVHTPEDRQRGDLLQDQAQQLWEETLTRMVQCYGDGRVAFEKRWDYNLPADLTFVRKLESLPYDRTEMQIDPDSGAFTGITLEGKDGTKCELDAGKSWWLAIDATAVEPHGRSRFLGAPYEKFMERKETLKLRQLFVERFSLRGGIAHCPETIEDAETGDVINVWDKLEEGIAAMQVGGILMFPPDKHPEFDDKYLYDFSEAKLEGFSASPINEILNAQDQEQLVAFGIMPKTVMEGSEVGSFAMVSLQVIITLTIVEDVLDQIVKSYQKYVVDKMMAVNWPKGRQPVLKVSYQKLTEKPDSLATEVVKAWLVNPQVSPLLMSGAIDVAQMLELVGIPVSAEHADSLTATLKSLALASQAGGTPTPEAAKADPIAQGKPADPLNDLPSDPVAPQAGQAGQAAVAGADDVASLALNGAQVTSLLDIVGQVRDGALPAASATAVIAAAFPALKPAQVQAILGPLANFTPPPAATGKVDMGNRPLRPFLQGTR